MKHYFIIAILLISANFSFGQIVQRFDKETAEQFSGRFKPGNSQITHKVIESTWNSNPVIIAFYEQPYKLSKQEDPDQQEYLRIVPTIFIKTESNKYKKIIIDTIESEGGDPFIESIFFANTDKDSFKELIIIASWQQRHYQISGKLYGTFVYDNFNPNIKRKLVFLKDISQKLDGGFEGDREGEPVKAKYKTAGEIKGELIKLGYLQ
jgi:hypothetical protein